MLNNRYTRRRRVPAASAAGRPCGPLRRSATRSGDEQAGLTMIELLVTITIAAIVTTMIIMTWWALQRSYAYSSQSTRAQETARDCMSRMTREIRDAQGQGEGQPFAAYPPIQYASANEIRFTTAFNDPGDGSGRILPVRYWYDSGQGTVSRQRDTNENGTFDEGDRTEIMARNVVNGQVPSAGDPTALFAYRYLDASGEMQSASSVQNTGKIRSVQIRIIVDLNPGRSPQYMDLVSSAQPRNQRQM